MLDKKQLENLIILIDSNYPAFKEAVCKLLILNYKVAKADEKIIRELLPIWNYFRAFINQYRAWNLNAKSSVLEPIIYHIEQAYKADTLFQKMLDFILTAFDNIKALMPSDSTIQIDNMSIIAYISGNIPNTYQAVSENIESFIEQFIQYSDFDPTNTWKIVKWRRADIKLDKFYQALLKYTQDAYKISKEPISANYTKQQKASDLKRCYTTFLSEVPTEDQYKLDLFNVKYIEVLKTLKEKGISELELALIDTVEIQKRFFTLLTQQEAVIKLEDLKEKASIKTISSDDKTINILMSYSIQPEYFDKIVYENLPYNKLPFELTKSFNYGLSDAEYNKQSTIKVFLIKDKRFKYDIPNMTVDNSFDVTFNTVNEIKNNPPKTVVMQEPEQVDCTKIMLDELKKPIVASKSKFKNVSVLLASLLRELGNNKYYCKDVRINPDEKNTDTKLTCEIIFTQPIFDLNPQALSNIRQIMNSLKMEKVFYFDKAVAKEGDTLSFLTVAYKQSEQEQEKTDADSPPLYEQSEKYDYKFPTIPALKYPEKKGEPEQYEEEYLPNPEQAETKIEDIQAEPPSWYERPFFVWSMVGVALSLAVLVIYLTRKNKKRGQQ